MFFYKKDHINPSTLTNFIQLPPHFVLLMHERDARFLIIVENLQEELKRRKKMLKLDTKCVKRQE